jgi:protein SCO1/2
LAIGSLLLAASLVAACGGASHSSGTAARSTKARFAGGVANPPFGARRLVLRDYRGRRVDLRRYRGKAVLVTFIYTHCPDVCPLIVAHLHTAQSQLGRRARSLRIVAVSTDPRGDTPKTVPAFLRAHQMLGRMDYLIGSRRELGRVWKAWGIAARPDRANPDLVEHSALIYGISAGGKVTTLYPSNFKPAEVVHDVPLLAAR